MVDLCEGGCQSEPKRAPPVYPNSCGNQSCHFLNYLKQSLPSPALHYLTVSPYLPLSLLIITSSLFLCALSPSSHSHRPIIGDTFQLCKIQSEAVAEHQSSNKNTKEEGELSAVTSDWAGCPQLTLSDVFFPMHFWIIMSKIKIQTMTNHAYLSSGQRGLAVETFLLGGNRNVLPCLHQWVWELVNMFNLCIYLANTD